MGIHRYNGSLSNPTKEEITAICRHVNEPYDYYNKYVNYQRADNCVCVCVRLP